MGGGLLNLVSNASSNIFLFGNPQKSLFYRTYKSITNFGMQRIRLDCDKKCNLSMNHETKYSFKVQRYADMLGDTHMVVNMPDIWFYEFENIRYEFSWIHEIGVHMINDIVVESGGIILARYSGEYFSLIEHRDNPNQLELWKEMIGHTQHMICPQYYKSKYPSIKGRKLYVPLKMWFTHNSDQALPLVALQYSPIYIHITIKPIKELYCISPCLLYTTPSEPTDSASVTTKKTSPASDDTKHRLFRFLQKPVYTNADNITKIHPNTNIEWELDIHLLSTYYFLDENERINVAQQQHKYLVKDVFKHTFHNLHGPSVLKLDTKGLVASYQLRCRRDDAYERNEWTNYSNYTYKDDLYPNSDYSHLYNYYMEQEIIKNIRIVIDGNERENTLDRGVLRYIEPYSRSKSNSTNYVYHYNFTTKTDVREYQPYGAMNMDTFEDVIFYVDMIQPPIKEKTPAIEICDENGNIIGLDQRTQDIFVYTYDLDIFEERYNVISIKNGHIETFFAR